ncbi:glutamate racemase [Galbibacter sp.]|uniref:glutamate racemase n=1 Tax=Galbibacter sp. TaxID=2918471 RepID=UPI003A95175E
MNSNPIGIFDSGLGGLSVWEALYDLMPKESMLYLADSKYAPYGHRPQSEIIQLSIKNMDYLLDHGCKIVVVACNTATTNAIDVLRQSYSIPIIGIEPAIKPAALNSKTGVVGVLATRGTLASSLFTKTAALYAKDRKVIEQYGDGLVTLIEAGEVESDQMHDLLLKYLNPMISAGIDYLVLGCTHYSFLRNQLEAILPPEVKIIDAAAAVARQTKNVLKAHDLLSDGMHQPRLRFYTNKDRSVMQRFLQSHPTHKIIEQVDF